MTSVTAHTTLFECYKARTDPIHPPFILSRASRNAGQDHSNASMSGAEARTAEASARLAGYASLKFF